MCNLIKYDDIYSKTPGRLWQYYRDEPFIYDNDIIVDVPDDPDSASFKYKQKWQVKQEVMGKRYSNNGTIKIF